MSYILNLPLDILAIIIAHVEPHDLCRIALVSRLLNSLATPKIYEEVIYGDALAQNWGKVLCPLKTLNSRPDLLVRLKSLDLTSVPWDEPDKNHSAPEFFVSYQEVLKAAQNLQRLAIGRYEDGFLGELICTPNELISSAQDQPKTRGSALLHLPSSTEYLLLRQPGESIIHGLVTLANSSQLSGLTNLRIIANDCLLPAGLSTILTNTPNLKALGIIRCACITLPKLLSSIGHLKLDMLEFGWASRNGGLERSQISFPSLPMLREISLRNIPVAHPGSFGHDHSRSATKDQLLYVLDNICCATLSVCGDLKSVWSSPS
ncbi:unnamed protein product [Rhizoctonia solani]|uniref:F-box domain-containing protein n=1 Tax=Rhizoctonia solani TaxID=456999 RepID=A0A8H7H180_9AGAM|nr:hypothetical protein RHS04_07750 [Rhizoctonia solani]CAE6449668.1 unnamed protein product [Rhizoctonia solani]